MPGVLRVERASFAAESYGAALFRRFAGSGAIFLVAIARRRVRGYVLASAAGGTGEIVSLAVDPEWRRAGIGRELMSRALAALAGSGATEAHLAVRTDNEGAIRFYRRFGFRRAGRLECYYEDGGDAWIMRRKLLT